MVRLIGIAVATLSLIVGAALTALWVRSYSQWDLVLRNDANWNGGIVVRQADSFRGRIYLFSGPTSAHSHGDGWKYLVKPLPQAGNDYGPPSQEWAQYTGAFRITIPYWLLVGISSAIAATPWARRFSLRALLIVMTSVSMLFAMATLYG